MQAVSEQIRDTGRVVLVPTAVVAETLNVVGKLRRLDAPTRRSTQLELGRDLLTSDAFVIAPSTIEMMREALEKLRTQRHDVSYTDALVMAYADHYGTDEIFGLDDAFSANGYVLPAKKEAA
jgi:predicted nucleic acid-binding protein